MDNRLYVYDISNPAAITQAVRSPDIGGKGFGGSAPCLHDGSAATLLDVLTTANTANRHGMASGLSGAELQQLVAYLQQIDDTPEGPAGLAMGNLVVFDSANAANWSMVAHLQYGDRSYALISVPAALVGATWLRTANMSRAYAGNPVASFSIRQAAIQPRPACPECWPARRHAPVPGALELLAPEQARPRRVPPLGSRQTSADLPCHAPAVRRHRPSSTRPPMNRYSLNGVFPISCMQNALEFSSCRNIGTQ